MTVDQEPRSGRLPVLRIVGPLRVPVSRDLRHGVRAMLRRGEWHVVVSLAAVPDIDAAGIGELVRAYNLATAANGVLRVVDLNPRVKELLARVGLLTLLSADPARTTATRG